MSYDLYLKPRRSDFGPADLVGYFSRRSNYTIHGTQAVYQNEDTGVYFCFDVNELAEGKDDPSTYYPVLFNINFYRPSYFIFEAESEVTAFVDAFDAAVFDPQHHGMGQGSYSKELLISGWNHGNKFAFGSMPKEAGLTDVLTLPSARLHEIWTWNLNRAAVQSSVGNSTFVPSIVFIKADGILLAIVVWTDGIPMLIPAAVDTVLVYRNEFAPRSFFRKKPDWALLSKDQMQAVLLKHGQPHESGASLLGYATPPVDVVQLVKGLAPLPQPLERIAADQVLDREAFQGVSG
jgi:hypothetical protein